MTTVAPAGLPLAGMRIVVTRARAQARSLTERLTELGATVVELPAIQIAPAPPGPLDDAIRRLGDYDWVLFTSVNGVRVFLERLALSERGTCSLADRRVGAIGEATADCLRESGIRVDFVPRRFVAESMVEGLIALGIRGKRVLLPRADIARDVLPVGLGAAGALVDIVVAYETRRPDDVDPAVLDDVRRGSVDIVTLASPSTARNIAELLEGELPERVTVVCIGPITASTARECGFRVDAHAREYSIPGLVEAIVSLASGRLVEGSDPDGAID